MIAVRAWAVHHAMALRDAGRRVVRNPVAAGFNAAVIGIALALPFALFVALEQLQGVAGQVSSDPQVSLFLALDAGEEAVRDVRQRLGARPEVAKVRFVSRTQALQEMKRTPGLAEVLDTLPDNPLPDAFIVSVRDNAPELLEGLRDEASRWPKVEHVQLDSEWARRLHAALRVSRGLALLLGGVLAGAMIAISFNTIRLQLLTRREEIEVCKLIGATNGYVRRPFLYFGALQGLLGGLVAWLLVLGGLWAINREVALVADVYASNFRLLPPSPVEAAGTVALAAALGWLGAWLSVTRYLWTTDYR